MALLIDTNVLSELLKPAPAASVLAWFSRHPADLLFVSAVTQAEMMLGARLLPAGRRRTALESALRAMFEEDFAGRVLPFDAAAVPAYVALVEQRRKLGLPISQIDAQIAAIATRHRACVVTRNTSDFEGCGLPLINPWGTAG